MKYYLIAGEASGDLHASNLVKELKKLDPEGIFRGWGGDLMQQQGVDLVKHYRDLAFMGFLEVFAHLNTIRKNLRFCREDVLFFRPDVLILVDYPGFNLRIAKFAHDHGIRVFYYISPQLWAWHSSRVKKIKKYVERMFVILPFENDFYARFDYPVDFVGHPLLDVINGERSYTERKVFLERNQLPDKPIIALLPGSRKQEIRMMLKVMLAASRSFAGYQFVIAAAPSIPYGFYRGITAEFPVPILHGQTYELLHHSEAALVTSGTATLETALMGIPQVVCYKGNYLSYVVARQLVSVKYISLVNLVVDREIIHELIQEKLKAKELEKELTGILSGTRREETLAGYAKLRETLGGPGASAKTARMIIQYMKEKQVTNS